MPKFSIFKLFSEAILPVVVVFGTKLLTIFSMTMIFNISWNLGNSASPYKLYFLSFVNGKDLIFISTWSNLAVTCVIGVWFAWILYQLNHLSHLTIPPEVSADLHAKKLNFLIAEEENLHHQIVVWLALSWFFLFSVLGNLLEGTTSLIIGGFCVSVLLTLTYWALVSSKIFSKIEEVDNYKSKQPPADNTDK